MAFESFPRAVINRLLTWVNNGIKLILLEVIESHVKLLPQKSSTSVAIAPEEPSSDHIFQHSHISLSVCFTFAQCSRGHRVVQLRLKFSHDKKKLEVGWHASSATIIYCMR